MREVELGRVCIVNPRRPSNLSEALDCSFIPMNHVDDDLGVIAEQDTRSVGEVSSGYTFFAENDVLFAKITPCMENGKAAIARGLTNNIGFGSTEFHVIRTNEEAIPEWIFYYLRQEQVRRKLERQMTGTAGQKRVPARALKSLTVPLPPLAEQRRLVTVLTHADRKRKLVRFALRQSEELLRSVFLEIFGEQAENPCGWPIYKLGTCIDGFDAGVNFSPVADGEGASDWRVLKVSSVTWGTFDANESKPISRDIVFDERLIVRQGDLLFSRANTSELVGAVAMVRRRPPRVLLPDKLWRICLKDDGPILPDYTMYALRQEAVRQIIETTATGTSGSMKNISKTKAALLPIMIPPMEMQQRFADIVLQVERLRMQQREALRQTDGLFQSLLNRTFRGGV